MCTWIRKAMTVSLTIILPIFMIIATGFFLARIKIIDASSGAQLMQYVFYCAAPFTVYYALTGNSSAGFFYWPFWIAYPVCYLVIITGSYFVFRFLRRKKAGISLALGFCASLGNTVLVAYPILIGITGASCSPDGNFGYRCEYYFYAILDPSAGIWARPKYREWGQISKQCFQKSNKSNLTKSNRYRNLYWYFG